MQRWYEQTLLAFSILIFLFAARESLLHFRSNTTRAWLDLQRNEMKNVLRDAFLMLVSAGPVGYYGLHLLQDIGMV